MLTAKTYQTELIGLSWGNLGLIFLLAITMRLFSLLFITDLQGYAFVEDSQQYWQGAKAWIKSGFFSHLDLETGKYYPDTERVPLYHLFLVILHSVFGDNLLPVILAQSVLDSCTCIIIGSIASMLNRTVGLVAGILAAAWPNMIIHSQLILADSLFLFLFVNILLFSLRYLSSARLYDAMLIGLFCGCAIMTRPIALFIPLAMSICAPFISRRILRHWWMGILSGIIILFFTLILVSPLMWRNISNYDSF